ncbi:hypothetical protein [Lignipirellula cremea]|uniref:Uncharacterized protein n=1 Tax=Lignipirellula cremea TaxID=2528010 RepID=A0A518DQ07_9BACT|nr:hypothetical protein [Lignipirellula cremea]QDU93925.1 hypothetical protein Pla8534_17110 [Lignipirellula cremea]
MPLEYSVMVLRLAGITLTAVGLGLALTSAVDACFIGPAGLITALMVLPFPFLMFLFTLMARPLARLAHEGFPSLLVDEPTPSRSDSKTASSEV